MSDSQDKPLTDEQREQLAMLLAKYAPSLPASERTNLAEQVENFAGQVAAENHSTAEGWIPVTVRHPIPGERVLIFVPRWGVLTIGWVSKANTTRWELMTMPGKNTDLVSHWQPLPTGPLIRPPE